MTHLALEVHGGGAHPAAARDLEFDPGALRRTATAAEDAGFALLTFADTPTGRGFEAGTRAAFLALSTHAIGLAPQLHTATTEPFHLATQLASLDHSSRGRAGWVVGAAVDSAALATIARADLADPRAETADVIEVARRLWDSWEDDAIIRDVASGRFLDADRVHHVNFAGAGFSVVGPLITPRPPQGQVVVLGSDTLGVTGQLDVALVDSPARAAAARADGAPLVFAEIEVVLDTPEASASDRLAALDAVTPWARTERPRHVGSVAGLSALLDDLRNTVDGVRLHPAVLTEDLPILATLPRRQPARRTLRETLGLPRPQSRYATAGQH